MNTRFTLHDLAQFCYENRGKHYREATFDYFGRVVCAAKDYDRLLFAVDDAKICAVCVATVYTGEERVHINYVFARGAGLRLLLAECKRRYPTFRVSGERGETFKIYKQERLWAIKAK